MNFTHIDTVFKTELFFALAALMAAFLLAFFATPLARKLAFRCRCLDIPDGKRKMHSEPIPYFGGIAILVGFAVAAAAFSFLLTGSIAGEIAVMLVGGIGICLVVIEFTEVEIFCEGIESMLFDIAVYIARKSDCIEIGIIE